MTGLLLLVAFASSARAQSIGTTNGIVGQGVSNCVTSGAAMLKGNGSGGCGNAVSGTDYAPATSGSSILKGNGLGSFANAVSGIDYAPATSGTSILQGNGSGGFSSFSGNSLSAHNFANSISANGQISGAQPAFSDIGGTAVSSQVPGAGGLQFGSTQLATTSTPPTSGQCLSYNGTGITGAVCTGGSVAFLSAGVTEVYGQFL